MSEFYTNIHQKGNYLYLRGIDNGHSYTKKVYFEPTLYQPSKNPNSPFKGVMGENLEPVKPGSIADCRKYISQYENVSNFDIFGNETWTAQYLGDMYKGTIDYDPSQVRVFYLDIEVQSGLTFGPNGEFNYRDDAGFPHAQLAEHPITLIGLFDSITKRYKIFGFGNSKEDYSKSKHFQNIKENGGQHDIDPDDIDYIRCDNEKDLLVKFLTYWSTNYPDIYTGWNTEGFDTPYIINRMTKILGGEVTKRLSPHGIINSHTRTDDYGNEFVKYNITGVSQIDYMELYKNFTYTIQDSYKLDHIATVELGDGKLSYEEAGTLLKLFRVDYQKYTEYNAIDVLVVRRLDDKLKFLDLIMRIAYYAKVNYEDVFSPVKTWDAIIYNYLLDRNICVPRTKVKDKPRQFAGAFVKDPRIGKMKWIASVDLSSLYPHLIMQYNIGPETLVPYSKLPQEVKEWRNNLYMYDFDSNGDPVIEGPRGRLEWIRRLTEKEIDLSLCEKYNLSFAANGEFFSKEKPSFLNNLMDETYTKRSFEKKKKLRYEQELVWLKDNNSPDDSIVSKNRNLDGLDSKFFYDSTLSEVERNQRIHDVTKEIARLHGLEMALKILLNSAYGILGSRYFRYFDLRVAEAITMSGQANIIYIASRISEEVNRLSKTDTSIDRVPYIDTDSNYIDCEPLVDIYTDNMKSKNVNVDSEMITDWLSGLFTKHFEPFIDNKYQEFAKYQNAYAHKMFMDREVIAESAMWTAKKRYIMKVLDSEGVRYAKPKYKVMGQDAIKSTTPEVCRDKLKEIYKVILDGDEEQLQDFVSDFKTEHKKMEPHMIAFNGGANGLAKYKCDKKVYVDGTPWRTRGALLYNNRVSEVEGTIAEEIMESDKVKFVALKTPNIVKYKTVAFPRFLEKDLGIHPYIDYNVMFQKTFLTPIQPMLDQLGWEHTKTGSLMGLFG